MAGASELKRLWRKCRKNRASKKQRARQESLEILSRHCKNSIALEEAAIIVVGLGLNTKQEEEYADYRFEKDPRFFNNPIGIGCSKTFEVPYDSARDSLSTSPASRSPLVSTVNSSSTGSDGLGSFPNLGACKSQIIDMVKGKRKGRMPGDSAEDRYKFLLDGRAARLEYSAKRFALVRRRTS